MEIKNYIASGILEMYVLGHTNERECAEVEFLASLNPEIKAELNAIEIAIEQQDFQNSVMPHGTIKPMVFSVIDLIERMEGGEQLGNPPMLTEASKIEDYAEWLNRSDMAAPTEFENLFGKIIGSDGKMNTLIVWIKHLAPEEVHNDEHEKFLIVEGTCTIRVGNTNNYFKAGDYFQIPLYIEHEVTVTSDMPCKVILQRVAA